MFCSGLVKSSLTVFSGYFSFFFDHFSQMYCSDRISPMRNLGCLPQGKQAVTVMLPNTQGCMDTVRECARKVDSGRKIPSHTGESNLCQGCAGLMLCQLSNIPTSTTNTSQICMCTYKHACTHTHTHTHTYTVKSCQVFLFPGVL